MPRTILPIGLLLVSVVTASGAPIPAKPDCDWKRDFGQAQKCFLLQFSCLDLYLGVEHPPDYPRALRCFEADSQSLGFVALMYFDGDGTSRNLQKAKAALKAGRKTEPYSFYYEPLEKAVSACDQNHLRACPHLDYCKDLAMTTFDMEVCLARDQVNAEADLSHRLALIRRNLNSSSQKVLDEAVTEFKFYQKTEASRLYDVYFDGTIRGIAGTGQGEFVRENFRKLLAETVESRELRPSCSDAVTAINLNVTHTFDGDINKEVTLWRDPLTDKSSDQATRDKYSSAITDYRKTAAESQLHWSKYRNLMTELASLLYPDHNRTCNASNGMKLAIAKDRIAELRNNPVGPQDAN